MDWNSRYVDADTPWDKGAATPVLGELIQCKPEYFIEGGRALVPGCGRGYDVIPLLDQGMKVTGMDISQAALNEAEILHGSSDDLNWLQADLFQAQDGLENVYDVVWEHTCYCAIQPSQREDYVDAMSHFIRPNGYLAGVFFIETGKPLEEGPPFKTSKQEVYENFGRKFKLVWEGKPESSYPGREDREWLMVWKKV